MKHSGNIINPLTKYETIKNIHYNHDLSNRDFSGRDLSRYTFNNCHYHGTNFSNTDILSIRFEGECPGLTTANFGGLILLRAWIGDPINILLFTSILGGLIIKVHDHGWESFDEGRKFYQDNTTLKLRDKLLSIFNYMEAVYEVYRSHIP